MYKTNPHTGRTKEQIRREMSTISLGQIHVVNNVFRSYTE